MVSESARAAIERDAIVQRKKRRIMYIAGGVALTLVVAAFVLNRLYGASCEGDTTDYAAKICYDMPDGWIKKPRLSDADVTVIGVLDGDSGAEARSYGLFGRLKGGDLVTQARLELDAYTGGASGTNGPDAVTTVDGHSAATAVSTLTGVVYCRATIIEIKPDMWGVLVTKVTDRPEARSLVDRLHKSVDVYE